jgi:hypothetical protein
MSKKATQNCSFLSMIDGFRLQIRLMYYADDVTNYEK